MEGLVIKRQGYIIEQKALILPNIGDIKKKGWKIYIR
jgi:hypothetical protein